MGALFLHLKPDEYLKKLYKTKKLVEKTSFSLQAEAALITVLLFLSLFFCGLNLRLPFKYLVQQAVNSF
ncbi:hypothetical protein D9C10_03460 [Bacillus subtilis subsp. subtilis]|nr:hypothetical protein D9C10_03460 [Bacillus subtilis subsp. subtilis]